MRLGVSKNSSVFSFAINLKLNDIATISTLKSTVFAKRK